MKDEGMVVVKHHGRFKEKSIIEVNSYGRKKALFILLLHA
jgi:hypothetical protein